MLRMIFRMPRQRIVASDGDTNSLEDSRDYESEESEYLLEPWVDWVKRVTHHIEKRMGDANCEDWIKLHRRKKIQVRGRGCKAQR